MFCLQLFIPTSENTLYITALPCIQKDQTGCILFNLYLKRKRFNLFIADLNSPSTPSTFTSLYPPPPPMPYQMYQALEACILNSLHPSLTLTSATLVSTEFLSYPREEQTWDIQSDDS